MEGIHESQYLQMLCKLEQVILNLNNENINLSFHQTMQFFDSNFPFSFKNTICMLIYSVFSFRSENVKAYLAYLKKIQMKEKEECIDAPKIIDIFCEYLLQDQPQRFYYLLESMIEDNLIDSSITLQIPSIYFGHYKTKKEIKNIHIQHLITETFNRGYEVVGDEFHEEKRVFFQNIEELSNNDWELHKQLLREGNNPSSIAKAIRNDNVEILQEIASQSNFDFNQIILPSVYERVPFVNQKYVSLIDYAAFFGSIKCFKFLLLNGSDLTRAIKFAIAGGNMEIIKLCEQNSTPTQDLCEMAIVSFQNDIFHYFYDRDPGIFDESHYSHFYKICVKHHNYDLLFFLERKCVKINEHIINKAAAIGDLFLVKHFLESNQIPPNILVYATESKNIELFNFIFSKEGIDINAKNKIYFNDFIFQNNIWGFLKLFKTALMFASEKGHTKIVKILEDNNS